jgi:hypothetical protein
MDLFQSTSNSVLYKEYQQEWHEYSILWQNLHGTAHANVCKVLFSFMWLEFELSFGDFD